MRGVNYPHTWFKNDAGKAIVAIAATKANVVRIVLSNGQVYSRDGSASVSKLLALCRKYKLVAMLEVHDPTGATDVSSLTRAANFWISLSATLRGMEDRVIINVANEWLSAAENTAAWAAAYRSVLPRLRKAGLKHLIAVDAAGYGQDVASVTNYGRSIFQADPLRNTIFSIHMYEVDGKDLRTIRRSIDSCLSIGVPLVIGEFSDSQGGKPVDYKSLMSYCKSRSVGWIAWSWFGNGAATANMDLASGPAGPLTKLGREIVDGPAGIKATSRTISTWQ